MVRKMFHVGRVKKYLVHRESALRTDPTYLAPPPPWSAFLSCRCCLAPQGKNSPLSVSPALTRRLSRRKSSDVQHSF
jgi:hypothetical protein